MRLKILTGDNFYFEFRTWNIFVWLVYRPTMWGSSMSQNARIHDEAIGRGGMH